MKEKKKEWKYIIVAFEYLLAYKENPMEYLEIMCDAILKKRGMDFEPEDVVYALEVANSSELDLSTLHPQPHSDAILREFFLALEATLKKRISNQ